MSQVPVYQDFLVNGQGGAVAQRMQGVRFDAGLMRPYLGDDGRTYCTINTGRSEYDPSTGKYNPVYAEVDVRNLRNDGFEIPTANAATSLRKDDWIRFDRALIRVARQRLRAWGDISAANPISFDGYSKSLYEYETVNDPGFAVVDMDEMAEGQGDSPRYQLEGIPLPITHSDFHIGKRKLAISRDGGSPIDTFMVEACTRRVAETVEKTLIGTQTGITYGTASNYSQTPTVYGYLNYPDRITKTNMAAPTGSNGSTVLSDWLALREELYDANQYGPFMVYTSTDYDQYLDNLFSTSEPSAGTLRSRLLQIDGISGIRRLDYLTSSTNPFTVIFVSMSPETVAAINGMDMSVMQWETHGGARINFKVMCIHVPLIRSDKSGQCGVAIGTTS